MKKFIPFQAVSKDTTGKFWYNSDYEMHMLECRWYKDWEVLENGEEVILNYAIDDQHFKMLGKELWRPFIWNPKEFLDINDLVWSGIYTAEKCWLKDRKRAYISVISKELSWENLAHKYFIIGDSMQRNFTIEDEDTGEIVFYLSLEEFDDFLSTAKFPGREKEKEDGIKHMQFLKSLPHWNKLKSWRGSQNG